MIKSPACMASLPTSVVRRSLRRLQQTLELQLPIASPAVEQPVPSEHSVLVRSAGYVGPRSTGRARHEPDSLQSVLQSRPGERGSPEEALSEYASSVVGQHRDGVGPHRWILSVSLDIAGMEPLDERVTRVELVDSDPPFELVEAHQIEHERGTHDPWWIPIQFVECLAQQALGPQHPVTHVAECVGIRLPEGVQILCEVRRILAHGLQRDNVQTVSAALLPEEAKVLFAIGRDLAQYRNPLVTISRKPRHAEGSITTAVPVAEPEAIFARQSLSARPADERDLELVGQWGDDDRVVRTVGTGDTDTALVDQVLEPICGIACRTAGQPVFRVDHELHRAVDQALLECFVERQPVDFVVAALGAVEGRAEPADLDRVW